MNDSVAITNSTETEICIYATVTDFEALKACENQEMHIQLEAKFESGVKSRTRTVIKKGLPVQHFMTFKAPGKGEYESQELTAPVDEAVVALFESAAERRLVKMRYTYFSEHVILNVATDQGDKLVEMPTLKYEVDVYQKADGSVHPVCKIDIEMDSALAKLKTDYPDVKDIRVRAKISHLPFKPADAFMRTDEEKTTAFWQAVVLAPTPTHQLQAPQPSESGPQPEPVDDTPSDEATQEETGGEASSPESTPPEIDDTPESSEEAQEDQQS